MTPTVSINLCCYNSEKYLRETLDSIVNQTYKDWELIIINDGSSDSTESIIHEYIKQGYPIIYHYQENKGLAFSRNEALNRSQGEFIAFIDHDDLWMPDKLEKQIPLFDNPEVGLVYSDVINFNENGKSHRCYGEKVQCKGECFNELLQNYILSIPTVIIRRAVLEKENEWFDTRFKLIEEYDFFIRISYRWQLDMCPDVLAKYRVHLASSSWIKWDMFYTEKEKLLKKYINLFPDFYDKYYHAIKTRIFYENASRLWRNNRRSETRRFLYPYIFKSYKNLLLYIVSFFHPNIVYKILDKIRNSREIRPKGFLSRKE